MKRCLTGSMTSLCATAKGARNTHVPMRFFALDVRFARVYNMQAVIRQVDNGPGTLAQLGEHLLCKQGVVGSSPISSTKKWLSSPVG